MKRPTTETGIAVQIDAGHSIRIFMALPMARALGAMRPEPLARFRHPVTVTNARK
jgi:hypothetical protein